MEPVEPRMAIRFVIWWPLAPQRGDQSNRVALGFLESAGRAPLRRFPQQLPGSFPFSLADKPPLIRCAQCPAGSVRARSCPSRESGRPPPKVRPTSLLNSEPGDPELQTR